MPSDYKRVLDAAQIAEAEGVTSIQRSWRRHVADPRGFLDVPKHEARYRPVDQRVHDWGDVYAHPADPRLELTDVSDQARRCMDCGIVLPLRNCRMPAGQPDSGMERPGAPQPLGRGQRPVARHQQFSRVHRYGVPGAVRGGVCAVDLRTDYGRLGHHQAHREDNRAPVLGRRLHPARTTRGTHGKSVAVVGSGPAGLAAAQQLTRAGHDVTVYERDDRLGGLLRYGIPEYKLQKSDIDRRIGQMEAEGTRFVVNCGGGTDISVSDLRAKHDAVVLAIGAMTARDNPVPGRDLNGVHLAMEHLVPANRECEGDGPSPITAAGGKHV